MTPAITCVRKAKVDHHVHKYQHNQSVKEYGSEAAAMLEVDQKRVFKTLVVELDGGELAVSLVAVFNQLSLGRCAAVLGAKSAWLAEPKAVQRSTGYVPGGVSPLGQKRKLRTIIESECTGTQYYLCECGPPRCGTGAIRSRPRKSGRCRV